MDIGKLMEERDDLLRSKLNEKELVLADLYDLAEYLDGIVDDTDVWIDVVADAINYVKAHCANE